MGIGEEFEVVTRMMFSSVRANFMQVETLSGGHGNAIQAVSIVKGQRD